MDVNEAGSVGRVERANQTTQMIRCIMREDEVSDLHGTLIQGLRALGAYGSPCIKVDDLVTDRHKIFFSKFSPGAQPISDPIGPLSDRTSR